MTPDEPQSRRDTLTLSREGRLVFHPTPESSHWPARLLEGFAGDPQRGLLLLGLSPPQAGSSIETVFWRDFSRLFLMGLRTGSGLSESSGARDLDLQPPREELARIAADVPPMAAAEDVSAEVLEGLWLGLLAALRRELEKSGETLQAFLERHGAGWNVVGRVCFHLAENKGEGETPFAFLATYSHEISETGKARHLPLGRALEEYAGKGSRDRLLHLLLPVQKATEGSAFLKTLVAQGEIYHPLAWTPAEAYRFLQDLPVFEAAGVIVRVPDWWQARKPPRPQVSVRVGGARSATLGLETLLEFDASVTLDGEKLSDAEYREILTGTRGLALIRGRWVEIDPEKLGEVLAHWKAVERSAARGGLSFIEGMRLLAGVPIGAGEQAAPDESLAGWSRITAGDALSQQLDALRDPGGKLVGELRLESVLKAELRPYQRVGVQWLWLLHRLGLGACLADDMGLGKTLQIIALLLLIRRERKALEFPSLLVVPASLLGNWKSEIERFAPDLRFRIVHPSSGRARKGTGSTEELRPDAPPDPDSVDLVITTYGYLRRLPWARKVTWTTLILDEAQAIKNPGSRQTREVKSLSSRHRIALTGTPVENRLADLWSLYDFLCPGLLGSARQFDQYIKAAAKNGTSSPYTALRQLIRPYLLRRLKTDRRIIADLPEKTEIRAFCSLTKTQAALYQQSVEELARKIERAEGIRRRGLVLSYLMRLKQICNHPSHWLRQPDFDPAESGKFARLREICEEIAARREKALVFTQFREMAEPLARFLGEIFDQPGLILHGETPVRTRKERVDAFQDDRGPPFFVLSLKAGGTGLNLTAASHVIHFDRWWNPAVENQATDRAYRIGQKKNVLVHPFICQGTIEERIDELIEGKRTLSREALEEGGEAILTELSNSELLKLVSLDIQSAMMES